MEKNIILLFGGDSDERLVSVASAQAIAEAIKPGHLWFWHHEGPVYAINYQELIDHKNPFTDDFKPKKEPIFYTIEEAVCSSLSAGHVFLLGLHGGSGENGFIQALFEKHNRAFTGSGSRASAVAFNKIATKEALRPYPIKMAPHLVIESKNRHEIEATLRDFLTAHQEIIVKPVSGGSSLGCFFIKNQEDIKTAAEGIVLLMRPFMAEKIIRGREITVGVIEDLQGIQALMGTEIVVDKDRAFDYQGKYLGKGTKEITPANLSSSLMTDAQKLAVMAHQGLSLSGYSRSDLILAEDGFYYLETNTLPGLTKSSLVPQQLAIAGITLQEFLHDQIKLATRKAAL